MAKFILSIDGGGIRGIIPAIILSEIEKRTKKPIAQIFDIMAGTSTGGIVVAWLCKKDGSGNPQYSSNDLVAFYKEYGPYIFKSSFLRKTILSWFNGSQYSEKNIEYVLDKCFGDDTLQDTLNRLLITSYDIKNNRSFFFKNWAEDRNLIKVKDALRAATAAPTYFTPKHLKIGETESVLIDGGVFANNPAVCAYASGKKLFPNDDMILLSIGTGTTKSNIDDSKKLGKIEWIKPLIHIMFASELDCVNYQLEQIIDYKYFRIQSQLTVASHDIDNVTAKNIACLEQEAALMIACNNKVIDAFCMMIA